jgi:hypothetical protein
LIDLVIKIMDLSGEDEECQIKGIFTVKKKTKQGAFIIHFYYNIEYNFSYLFLKINNINITSQLDYLFNR